MANSLNQNFKVTSESGSELIGITSHICLKNEQILLFSSLSVLGEPQTAKPQVRSIPDINLGEKARAPRWTRTLMSRFPVQYAFLAQNLLS